MVQPYDANQRRQASLLRRAKLSIAGLQGCQIACKMLHSLQPEMELDKVKCSLRSTGAEDTSVISKTYYGGGHLNASSFIIDKQELEQWLTSSS